MDVSADLTGNTPPKMDVQIKDVGVASQFRTPLGLMLLASFLLTLFSWTSVISEAGLSTAIDVAICGFAISWLIVAGFYAVHIFVLHDKLFPNWNWLKIQTITCLILAVVCFISFCCLASTVGELPDISKISVGCGFISVISLVVTSLGSFHAKEGRLPCQKIAPSQTTPTGAATP